MLNRATLAKEKGASLRALALMAPMILFPLTCAQPQNTPPGDPPEKAAPATPTIPVQPPGRWTPFRKPETKATLSPEQRDEIAKLAAIGYLGTTERTENMTGVRIHDPRAFEGLNLYTSGHAPEAVLMDMKGQVLHTWSRSFREIWPDAELDGAYPGISYWRRALALPNGDLAVIFEGLGIACLDKNSKVRWSRLNHAHHDLAVDENGNIVTLTFKFRVLPRIDAQAIIREDFITVMDKAGNTKSEVSVLECFENSPFAQMLDERREKTGDIFHTNTVEILDEAMAKALPAFRAGNILTSMRNMDVVAVVDIQEASVVWAHKGSYREQHDPTLLENGHLLLFDNLGQKQGSAVWEFELPSMKTVWSYRGGTDGPLMSWACGANARLANGNTLITESDNGRAFEVTPERDIVWEFINPNLAGKNNEYVATLFEIVRLPLDFPAGWLD